MHYQAPKKRSSSASEHGDRIEFLAREANRPRRHVSVWILCLCILLAGCVIGVSALYYQPNVNIRQFDQAGAVYNLYGGDTHRSNNSYSHKAAASPAAPRRTAGKVSSQGAPAAASEVSAVLPDNGPANTVGNSAANVASGAFLAAQGGMLYYPDNDRLLTAQNTETGEILTLTDFPVGCLGVVGNQVFASEYDSDYGFLELDLAGSIQAETLIACQTMAVLPDQILTSDSRGIYRVDRETTLKSTLYIAPSPLSAAAPFGERIYFLLGGALYSLSMDGSDQQLLSMDAAAYTVGGDGLFAASSDGTVYNLSTGEILPGVLASSLNVSDGSLYYANLLDGGKLYVCALSGGSPQKLSDLAPDRICVCGGTVAVEQGGVVSLV